MYDVAVVGAGLAGAAMSLLLAKQGARVALIERQTAEALAAEAADGRTTAIAAGARGLFDRLGVWNELEPDAGPILDIRVSDRDSILSLHFDHRAVGDEPMGHIVENFRLRRALLEAVQAEPTIAAYWGVQLTGFETADGSAALVSDQEQVIEANLAIAADGRGSTLRRLAGIGVRAIDYRQTAIVCTIHHECPHDGIAHERFLNGGPFAVLPMTNAPDGSHRSSIVWTEKRELAEYLLTLPRPSLERELRRRLGGFLGDIAIHGNCWSYPLSLTVTQRLTGRRLTLVGEAAHGIHPIAGQGFNVSVRDIETLGHSVGQALAKGMDPGGRVLLNRYAQHRWPDILAMIAATDGLNRLFLADLPPFKLGRRLGLAAVDRIPPLKRQFQRHAMGLGLFGQAS